MALWVSLPSLLTFEYFSTCLLTAREKKDCDNKFRHWIQTPSNSVCPQRLEDRFSGKKKKSIYIERERERDFFARETSSALVLEDTLSLMVSEFIVTILLFSCCQKTSGKILKCKQRRETYPKCHYYKHCHMFKAKACHILKGDWVLDFKPPVNTCITKIRSGSILSWSLFKLKTAS